MMSDKLLTALADITGSQYVATGQAVAGHEFPWSTHHECLAKAIIRPGTTDEVAAILRTCNEAHQSVVPFGGTTNLVHGCATTADDVILSLQRLNRIEEIDRSARTLTAEAGVTLHEAQQAAADAELFFPVDIGARDECQLGGIVSTNAGGTRVIRHGMTRDCILGLEAVLADGTVVSSMNRYVKNNSGFDLKQMFIGSEGVLGVITRAVFRLSSQLQSHSVALLACDRYEDVVATLDAANRMLPNTMTGFEVMWNSFYELAVEPLGRLAAPLPAGSACYILLETTGTDDQRDAQEFESFLELLLRRQLIADGVIGKSETERELLWDIRHEVEPVIDQARNYDVSLRSADAGRYVDDVEEAVGNRFPDSRVIGFGHLGDNNVHVSVQLDEFTGDKTRAVDEIVYGCLEPFAGAISAEHGIGLDKRAWLSVSRTPAEIELMRKLKRMLDPNNILNPGKVVDV